MRRLSDFSAVLAATVFLSMILNGCNASDAPALSSPTPDLVIYTSQEEEIYAPVIKEFMERTGMEVSIRAGSSDDLISRIRDEKSHPDCDILFGAGIEHLEASKDLWQPYESPEAIHISQQFRSSDYSWTAFSALPMVIMYNTKVVTYRELPTGWSSLLEPRWKGRVAFVNPEDSDVYALSLATAVRACPEIPDYLDRFAENLNYQTLTQTEEVNTGVSTGRYSVGVTPEESAQILLNEGADIDYIYPEEGTVAILDGTAIIKNCAHSEAAKAFLNFTVSKDAQRVLVSSLNRRSIRDDISPLSGLSSIHQIPLLSYNLSQVPGELDDIQARWAELTTNRERRQLP